MFCSNCGFKNRESARFCTQCGEALLTEEDIRNEMGMEEAEPLVVVVSGTDSRAAAQDTTQAAVFDEAAEEDEKADEEINADTADFQASKAAPQSRREEEGATAYRAKAGAGGRGAVRKRKPLVVCAVLAIFAGALALGLWVSGMVFCPRISMDEYVTFTPTGYDGYGDVEFSIDWASFFRDHAEDIKFTDEGKSYAKGFVNEEGNIYSYLSSELFLEMPSDEDMAFYGTLPQELGALCKLIKVMPADENMYGHVANGDEVEYKIVLNEEALDRYFKTSFKAENGSVKVATLDPLDPYDPFDNLDVSYEMDSDGTGSIYMNYGDYDYDSVIPITAFHASKSEGVKPSDTITVTLELSKEELDEMRRYNGIEVSCFKRDYKAGELPEPDYWF